MAKNKIVIKRSAIENFLMSCIEFVKKNRKIVSLVSISLFIVILGAISFSVYVGYSANSALIKYEKIIMGFSENIKENASDANKEKNILETAKKINELVDSSCFGFVSNYGDYILGSFYYEAKKWKEAKEHYIKYAESSSSDFVPVAYLKAGVCEENLGNFDEALKIYEILKEDYLESDFADHILYSLGRMFQKKSDFIKAKEYYTQVIDPKKRSSFARNAKQRIFMLSYKK